MKGLHAAIITLLFVGIGSLSDYPATPTDTVLMYFVLVSGRDWITKGKE